MSKANEALLLASKLGYKILKSGEIQSKSGHILSGFLSHGYKHFSIKLDGMRLISVSRLQAYQKYGDKIFEEKIYVRHLDGNPLNNSSENILIGTQHENLMDRKVENRISHSLRAVSFVKKFTSQQVAEIRKMRSCGFTMREIGEKYSIGKGHVSDIVNGKLYKHEPMV